MNVLSNTPEWIKTLIQHGCKVKQIDESSVVISDSYLKGYNPSGFISFDSLLILNADKSVNEYVFPSGQSILQTTSRDTYDSLLSYLGY